MAHPNGSAAPVVAPAPEKSPIERWIERHIKNGGDSADIVAAARFVDELQCADSIAETVAPKMFGLDAKLALRDCLGESKSTLETLDISDLDGHARMIDAAQDSPIGQWLTMIEQRRSTVVDPRLHHLLALETAAARDVLADIRCAQAAGRTVFAGQPLTPVQALKLLEGLCETKERLASLSEQNAGGDTATST